MSDEPRRPKGSAGRVAIFGATGYVGGHLIRPLEESGFVVCAAARSPRRLRRLASEATDVRHVDAFQGSDVTAALEGAETAFYLMHQIGAGRGFAERDRRMARVFAEAAASSSLRRIVFLGVLGPDVRTRRDHIASRHEVGEILASSGVPVVEFRASIIIGSGSTSFEMIRNLVEKQPVVFTPRWAHRPSQPIAIDDVISYLVSAVTLPDDPERAHRIYEIGGGEVVSYLDLLRLYARQRGLRRLVVALPLLPLAVSTLGLRLLAPKQAAVGRQLARSLRYSTVITCKDAQRDFPGIRPISACRSLDEALATEEADFADTLWSEELADYPVGEVVQIEREGRYVDSRSRFVACPASVAFAPVLRIGGEKGWYAFEPLWDLRGFIDFMAGGPGRDRTRRDMDALSEGDRLEWWHVRRVRPPHLLQLDAEMVSPGHGRLQYELTTYGGVTLLRQTATFDPKGLGGRAYWLAMIPFHHLVFEGTLKGIESECPVLGPLQASGAKAVSPASPIGPGAPDADAGMADPAA